MKISIIIPVFNVEAQISDCLMSVMNQSWHEGDLECILVDDCGTDKSMSIVKKMTDEYKGNISFRIICHSQNRGLSVARNTGIKAAQGDYVYFLDSDDCLTPDCLTHLAKPLNKFKYDFVIGDYRLNGPDIGYPKLLLPEGEVLSSRKIMETLGANKGWYTMAWNKLCNKQFLNKYQIEFEEGILHEDELWSFILSYYAETMFVVKKQTYIYNVRDDSIIKDPQKKLKRIEGLYQVYYKENKLYSKADRQLDLLANFIYSQARKVLFLSFSEKLNPYQFYKRIRNNNKVQYYNLFRNNSVDFFMLLKNIHYYMPYKIGFCLMFLHYFISCLKNKVKIV